MKISGALKTLIKRLETPGVITAREGYPQNYDKALEIIKKRKERKSNDSK